MTVVGIVLASLVSKESILTSYPSLPSPQSTSFFFMSNQLNVIDNNPDIKLIEQSKLSNQKSKPKNPLAWTNISFES